MGTGTFQALVVIVVLRPWSGSTWLVVTIVTVVEPFTTLTLLAVGLAPWRPITIKLATHLRVVLGLPGLVKSSLGLVPRK